MKKVYLLPENLAILRKKKKLSQNDLAEKIGVHVQTVKNWEGGSVAPSMRQLNTLCHLYNCEFIVGKEKHPSIKG